MIYAIISYDIENKQIQMEYAENNHYHHEVFAFKSFWGEPYSLDHFIHD